MSEETINLPERVQQMAALFQQGHSFREIAQQMDCSYHNVRQQLYRYEVITPEEKAHERASQRRLIHTLYEQGLTQQQIALQMGLSQTWVSACLRQPIPSELPPPRPASHTKPRTAAQATEKPKRAKADTSKEPSHKRKYRKKPLPERVKRMAALYEQRYTFRAIGEQLGCSPQNVQEQLQRRGLIDALRLACMKREPRGRSLEASENGVQYPPPEPNLLSSDSDSGTGAGSPRAIAGRKGGVKVSQNREHMAQIGRKGGEKVAQDREHMAQIGRKGGKISRRTQAVRDEPGDGPTVKRPSA